MLKWKIMQVCIKTFGSDTARISKSSCEGRKRLNTYIQHDNLQHEYKKPSAIITIGVSWEYDVGNE